MLRLSNYGEGGSCMLSDITIDSDLVVFLEFLRTHLCYLLISKITQVSEAITYKSIHVAKKVSKLLFCCMGMD